MSDLYPLRLHPEFHERVWGADSLAPIYSREITGNPIGEVWLTGDNCTVANGPLSGRSLAQLSAQFGPDLLGDTVSDPSRFPLLIKFLFPRDKLSVQVHPDDEGAKRVGQSCGKTECWYVLEAEPGAQVGLGLKAGVSKDEVERAIHEKRLEELLNWVEVHKDDMIYVDAGTVHAIGPGAVIVETQQNSDTTYRLYDYGRPRELHIEDGLRATKEQTCAGKVHKNELHSENGKTQVNLITSPCFVVDKFTLSDTWEFRRPQETKRSVWCMVVTKGNGVVVAENLSPISVNSGEVVVIPAAVERFMMKPQWELEFLCSSLPVEAVQHPRTRLLEATAVPG